MMYRNKLVTLVFLSFLLFFLPSGETIGQKVNYENDNFYYTEQTWLEFVNKAEKELNLRFYFDEDSLTNFNIKLPRTPVNFVEKLSKALEELGYFCSTDNAGNIFVTQKRKIDTNLPLDFFNKKTSSSTSLNDSTANENNFLATSNNYIYKHFIIGEKKNIGNSKVKVSGYVRNSNDNSPIVGAVLKINENNLTVATNDSGYYSMRLKKGSYTLFLKSIESKDDYVKIEVQSSGKLDLALEPKLIELNEIIVNSEKDDVVRSTQMGFQKLEAKNVKEIPLVLGERDVVKVSMLLPGVQTVGEGSSGFNVRGSPVDQNLFVINNVPIYNSSHLFGFFSAFNSDAVEHFSLYKSSIPSSFGGRLAAVFDIKTKNGDQNKFKASGGISPITARLMIEGPIKKKKSSYLIGFRSTYSDWLLKKVNDEKIKESNAEFADFVANFSFNLDKKNSIQLFLYHSYDKIKLADLNKYNYLNTGASVSWKHLFKKKHSLDVSLIYSQYDFMEENTEIDLFSYKDNFTLNHNELKSSFTFNPNEKHKLSVGFNSILYQLDNGDFLPLDSKSVLTPIYFGSEKALESGIYLSHQWILSNNLSLIGGLRYNSYMYLGPNDVRRYAENTPKLVETILDTVSYSNNKLISYYGAPDIRLALRYILGNDISVKLSYSQLKQYAFMLTNTIAVSPTDKWKLSDNNIKPMSGNQYSIGFYKHFLNEKFNLSFEVYYKTVNNQVEYKNGANLIANEALETDVLQGKLKMYGTELMLKKSYGKFNGWINYTYSNARIKVDSYNPEERINEGVAYPSNYDKPHAVNLVANYKFLRRFSLSSNIVYSTGRPITYPVGVYYFNDREIPLYSKRNEYRIPDYFRVDFSLKLEGNLASKKFAHGTWILSIYNLTGRKNAYSVYFKSEEYGIKGYKLSIFGAPIVSLTYSFKLGNYAN